MRCFEKLNERKRLADSDKGQRVSIGSTPGKKGTECPKKGQKRWKMVDARRWKKKKDLKP